MVVNRDSGFMFFDLLLLILIFLIYECSFIVYKNMFDYWSNNLLYDENDDDDVDVYNFGLRLVSFVIK